MTKMKKLFAVVLALAMLLTMASFSAMAESVTVDLSAAYDVESNKISVDITADASVGGLTATLGYDKAVVKYVDIEENAGNQAANTVADNNGQLKVAVLGNNITVNFVVVGAAESTTFTLTEVVASNSAGTATLEVADVASATVNGLDVLIEARGNTIRKTVEPTMQDLGFVSDFFADVVPANATNVVLGFVALPTAMLDGGVLTLDTPKRLNAEYAFAEDANFSGTQKFRAYIAGIVNDVSRMGTKISGRFYVSYINENGEAVCIYSANNQVAPSVTSGEVSKSFVGTCKAMASVIVNKDDATLKYGENDYSLKDKSAVNAIITKETKTDENEKKAILEFVVLNADLLDEDVAN